MSIGSTIKKLRHENDMTQEQLAQLLGLTSAAISGWECDRNAPDISQIPLLSHIFGVSADILLEIDLSRQEEKINEICFRAHKQQTLKGMADVFRSGLAEFPSSYSLMLYLADALNYNEPEGLNDRLKERIALYERVRECTKDPHLKNCAEGRLCSLYLYQGKRDEALKIAESVPHFDYSRDDLDRMCAQGGRKSTICMTAFVLILLHSAVISALLPCSRSMVRLILPMNSR